MRSQSPQRQSDAESTPLQLASGGDDPGVAECWACRVLITVPLVDGAPAPLFRCGWCGAINDGPSGAQPGRLPGRKRRTLRALAGGPIKWLVVGFVIALIGGIASVGVCVVLPRAFPSPSAYAAHAGLSLVLLSLTSFHYVASVCRSPGRVSECAALPARAPEGHYPEGAFEGWSFCSAPACSAPKPPGTHHCRTCGVCVVGQDHHCPFIGNCVGRGNIRAFLLFLAFACAACGYALAVCIVVICSTWPATAATARAAAAAGAAAARARAEATGAAAPRDSWVVRTSMAAAVVLAASPWWLIATYYLAVASAAVLVCVGLLLVAQLRYLASGVTYIDYIKAQQQQQQQQQQQHVGDGGGQQHAASEAPCLPRPPGLWPALVGVMGSSNPLLWLVPRWDPPPAAEAGDGKKAA